MDIFNTFLKRSSRLLGWYKRYLTFFSQRPLLIAPIGIIHVGLFVVLLGTIAEVGDVLFDPDNVYTTGWFWGVIVAMVFAFALILLFTLIVNFAGTLIGSLAYSLRVQGLRGESVRIVQVLFVFILFFSFVHYYIFLFSNFKAYDGIDSNWIQPYVLKQMDPLEKLRQVPSAQIIVDVMYFSAVTTGTVGYGDVKPVSFKARVATSIQIVGSFLIVVVVLGRAILAGAQPKGITRKRIVRPVGTRYRDLHRRRRISRRSAGRSHKK